MHKQSLAEVLACLEGIIGVGADVPVNRCVQGCHSDSRKIAPGDVFVAMPGFQSQGVDYLPHAFESGALAALIPEEAAIIPEYEPRVIRTSSIRRDAAWLTAAVCGYPTDHLLTIGVTGTNGKTSSCYFIRHILEAAGHRVVLLTTVAHEFEDWHQATPNTTPDAPLLQWVLSKALAEGATAAVIEVSAHAVALDRILGCRFDGLVFTNLALDHQDFFTGMEPYYQAKRALFMRAELHKSQCIAAICLDDPYGGRLASETPLPVIQFGADPTLGQGDVSAHGLVCTDTGIEGQLRFGREEIPVMTPLAGQFNCLNLAGSGAITWGCGIRLGCIEQAMNQSIKVPGRMMMVPTRLPFQVVVDFAHTDSALAHLIQQLRPSCKGRLIVVFGAGGDKDPLRRQRLPEVVFESADVGVITLDNPRSEDPNAIIETMVAHWYTLGADQEDRPELYVRFDRKAAIHLALALAQPGDLVLIAGKGHETTQIFANHVEHHNDHEIAQAWIHRAELRSQ